MHPEQHHAEHSEPSSSVTDPVCGMTVSPSTPHRAEVEGHEVLFSSNRCLEKFKHDADSDASSEASDQEASLPPKDQTPAAAPRVFTCPMHPEVREPKPGSCPKCGMALELASPALPVDGKAEWTCPMHPEIVRDAPGSCPICGMTLEQRTQSGTTEESDGELGVVKWRLCLAIAFTAPLLAIAKGENVAPVERLLEGLMSMRARNFVELALATPVCLWAAWPFFVKAAQSLKHRSLNMFTLIGLGVRWPTATASWRRCSPRPSQHHSAARAARRRCTSKQRA
jgi:P-type Cu+ transporter